jgi:hypothetical protein
MRLVPIQEASQRVGVNQVTLYRAMTAGRLKRYKQFGDKRTFVDIDELKALRRPSSAASQRNGRKADTRPPSLATKAAKRPRGSA